MKEFKGYNLIEKANILKDYNNENLLYLDGKLVLKEDGKFEWVLIVGSLDQEAQGTWWKNGDCIGLKPDSKYLKSLQIFPTQLNIVDNQLEAIWIQGEANGIYTRGEDLQAMPVDED